ncbi:cytochrome C biogenesis protein [Shewanella denitrificans OS217]|jgi:cytochrome c nitrite reductase accessory protein NrfF|uniref:Formate-dependent nitrite reductase complex subunit n=1 Tax=Shewanella denitrificans (strain OS217 / ATCC BAA-1090 / DSM 15013) TaxID=318161 RepID=Q12I87_SHEDO|nr:cytochrome C biogenesis protein [Shewanella denitrificans OS217]MBB1268707.1 heme lyase NrfEFG subunit NrfF [Shewanella sp. SR44-3]
MIRTMLIALCLFISAIASTYVQATPVDTFAFSSAEKQKRALSLAHELRCPQCQNQNLIDSNSPVAKDLRLQVYQMVEAGKGDDEIVEFMTSRYGDFVLYKPKLDPKTYVLWIGPFVLLLFGLIIGFVFVRKQRIVNNSQVELTEADQQELAALLKQDKD